jgi:hypothetical protein
MPRRGKGISLPGSQSFSFPVFVQEVLSPPQPSIPLAGLSVWLKADAGLTTTPFISQVVVSGAGTTTSNGTYTRASGGETQFNGPSGNYIYWDEAWNLHDDTDGSVTYTMVSYDPIMFSGVWVEFNGSLPVPTSITTTTLLVTGWADQSGNGNNASQYSGSSPTYSLIGGKSFVSFAAFVDLFLTNSVWGIGYPYIGTIFTVARFPSSSSGGNARLFHAEADTNYFVFGRGIESTNAFFVTNNEEDYATSSPNVDNNTNYILETTFDEQDALIYLNGTLAGDTSVSSNTSVGNEFIGGGEEPSSIAEMVVYNRVLTTPERQQVEQYLNSKYQIYTPPAVTPTPTATPAVTPTPTATPAVTPTPTPTETPTNTPTPTVTKTPTLTPSTTPVLPLNICVSNAGDARIISSSYTRYSYSGPGGRYWYVNTPDASGNIFLPNGGPNLDTTWTLWCTAPSPAKVYYNPSTDALTFPIAGWLSVNSGSNPPPTVAAGICPTPTPTPTVTITPTATPAVTPTPTATPAVTPTPTPTVTASSGGTDTAVNYTTFGTTPNPVNGGSAFDSWSIVPVNNAGTFRASSNAAGFGDVDTAGFAFAAYGNPNANNFVDIKRNLAAGLTIGYSFSAQIATAYRSGAKGISLYSDTDWSVQLFNFNVGGDQYTFDGSNQGWAYSQTSIFNISAAQVTSDQLNVRVWRGSDAASKSITAGQMRGFKMYIANTDAGNALNDLYFNNLAVYRTP